MVPASDAPIIQFFRISAFLLFLLQTSEAMSAQGCPLATPLAEPQVEGGLSLHFRRWLERQGLSHYDFPRDDLAGGSFGGRHLAEDPIRHDPIVFIHGNSDRATGTGNGVPLGWAATLRFFLDQGYSLAELYATTWGPADAAEAADQIHSWKVIARLRAFIEAVLAYTGAEKLDVIGHSMGVTLARKAIKGGMLDDPSADGPRDLGPPLTDRIDTFVGVAGANWGLANCFGAVWSAPTCSSEVGFFPGVLFLGRLWGLSDYLDELNADPGFEGEHVYSIWSRDDPLIGYGGLVNGRYTSEIPGQDGEKVFSGYPYGHFCVRDLSAPVQLQMVKDHHIP